MRRPSANSYDFAPTEIIKTMQVVDTSSSGGSIPFPSGSNHHPERFLCPLSDLIMNDPVTTPYGDNFERTAILKYLKKHGDICPISGRPLKSSDLIPNSKLQWEAMYWQRQHTSSPPTTPDPAMMKEDASPVAPTRKSMIGPEDEIMTTTAADTAPRQPRRRSRCDKTLSLDESDHDYKPSVPRRKNSDGDLSNTFFLACQASIEASCNKPCATVAQDTVQRMVLSEFMRSVTLGGDDSSEEEKDQSYRTLSEPDSILLVLDEVEQTLSMDMFEQ